MHILLLWKSTCFAEITSPIQVYSELVSWHVKGQKEEASLEQVEKDTPLLHFPLQLTSELLAAN